MALIFGFMLTFASYSEKSLNLCRCLAIIAGIAAPVSTAVSSVASTALVIVWLISGKAWQTLKISLQNPVSKMILVFFAWLAIGTFYADSNWPPKISKVLIWKKLLFVLLLLGLFFQQQQWQRRFVLAFTLFMSMAAIVAIPLWALDVVVRTARQPGVFMTNYSTQSTAFIAALLCCLYLAQTTRNRNIKIYLWLAGLLLLFNILFISPARSGYLALPPAILFSCVCLYGYRKLPAIAGILLSIVLLAGLSSETLQQRIQTAVHEQSSYQTSNDLTSVGVRMVFYKNAVELIKEKPLFGHGTATFQTVYSAHFHAKNKDWRGESTSDPHNQYLFIWVENGLIGLLLFFAYILTAIREGLKHKPYGGIAASVLVAICTSSLFNSHFKTFAEGYMLAYFLGMLLAGPPLKSSIKANA